MADINFASKANRHRNSQQSQVVLSNPYRSRLEFAHKIADYVDPIGNMTLFILALAGCILVTIGNFIGQDHFLLLSFGVSLCFNSFLASVGLLAFHRDLCPVGSWKHINRPIAHVIMMSVIVVVNIACQISNNLQISGYDETDFQGLEIGCGKLGCANLIHILSTILSTGKLCFWIGHIIIKYLSVRAAKTTELGEENQSTVKKTHK